MERTFILGAIAVCAIAVAAATSWKHGEVDRAASAGSADPDPIRIEFATPSPAPRAERHPSSPIDERRDDALLAHVEYKYRYLLADVESEHIEELKRRLLAYEGEENISRKVTTDAHVNELLSPREREYYQALKESDLEQHQVAEYVGGVGNVAPLDPGQERQVLDAKLRQKQRYTATLRDAGLDRETLSDAERRYAQAQVAEALKGYRDDFLLEVSPSLTSEQYTLLKNYETTEYQRELERLQRQIDSK